MKENFAVIGGDLRLNYLVKEFALDENKVYVYGLQDLENIQNIHLCDSLEKAINNSKIIISSIPFSKDNINVYAPFSKKEIRLNDVANHLDNKIFFAGNIANAFYNLTNDKNVKIIDLMQEESLTILNTIATAEGAITEIILNTHINLHSSKVLILGFGRVAKTLAKKLSGLDAIVTCAARKEKDFAWIETLGYDLENINELGKNLKKYDIIVNTVPQLIINEERLKNVKKDCLIIDLASKPGGVDQEACKKEKIKFIWALAIPGKISPKTSAQIVKTTIYNKIRKEI